MYQIIRVPSLPPPPPRVDRDRFVAVLAKEYRQICQYVKNIQFNARPDARGLSKVCSVFQK